MWGYVARGIMWLATSKGVADGISAAWDWITGTTTTTTTGTSGGGGGGTGTGGYGNGANVGGWLGGAVQGGGMSMGKIILWALALLGIVTLWPKIKKMFK